MADAPPVKPWGQTIKICYKNSSRGARDHGVDSDESTDDEENEANDRRNNDPAGNNDPAVPDDPVDPEDEDSIKDTIEAVLRQSTIAMFRRVLIFSPGAATSLHDDQMITTFDVLRELDDDTIKEICRAIKKPGGAAIGYQISKLSVTRFKLFAFWARHMWRTC